MNNSSELIYREHVFAVAPVNYWHVAGESHLLFPIRRSMLNGLRWLGMLRHVVDKSRLDLSSPRWLDEVTLLLLFERLFKAVLDVAVVGVTGLKTLRFLRL